MKLSAASCKGILAGEFASITRRRLIELLLSFRVTWRILQRFLTSLHSFLWSLHFQMYLRCLQNIRPTKILHLISYFLLQDVVQKILSPLYFWSFFRQISFNVSSSSVLNTDFLHFADIQNDTFVPIRYVIYEYPNPNHSVPFYGSVLCSL